MNRITFGLATLVVSLLTLLTREAAAQCTSDNDCKAGRICKNNECAAPTCQNDKDCPGDLVCSSGACTTYTPPTPSPASEPSPPAPGPTQPEPTPAPGPLPTETPQGAAPPAAPGTATPGTNAQAVSGMESVMLDCSTTLRRRSPGSTSRRSRTARSLVAHADGGAEDEHARAERSL